MAVPRISSDTRSIFLFNTICFTCFQVVATFYLMSKLYVRMHAFILCHHQLSLSHQKTHPKISDCTMSNIMLSSVKFPGKWKSIFCLYCVFNITSIFLVSFTVNHYFSTLIFFIKLAKVFSSDYFRFHN